MVNKAIRRALSVVADDEVGVALRIGEDLFYLEDAEDYEVVSLLAASPLEAALRELSDSLAKILDSASEAPSPHENEWQAPF